MTILTRKNIYRRVILRKMYKKFVPSSLFVYLVVLRIQFTAAQVVLEVCADADLGSQCVLTCKTPDNTQFISFAKTSDLSNTLGFCLVNGGGCSVTDPNKYYMNQTGGVTKFIILSHNKSDTGTWRCDYSGTFNDRTLKWAQLPTAILTSTGISANTVVNQTSSIPVTVGVGCLYSENAPVVEVQYLPETYLYVMTCAKSATLCGDSDLSAYDCNKTITSVDATCGDTLYTMQLKVSVSNTRNTYQQQLFSPFKIKFECSSYQGSPSCQEGEGKWCLCWICNIIDKIIFAVIFFLVDVCYCGTIYKKYFRLDQFFIRRKSESVEIESFKMFLEGRRITEDLTYVYKHGHAVHSDITFNKTGRYQCDVKLDNQQNLTFYFNFKGCDNDKNLETFIEFENDIKLDAETISVQWIRKNELTSNSRTFLSYQSKTMDDEHEINVVISFDLNVKWCWICNTIDKIIFAVLLYLVDACYCVLGTIYKKYFRLDQLVIRRKSKRLEIDSFKMFFDGSETPETEDLTYVYKHGHAVHCDITFKQKGFYQCAVILDNQQNLTFYFNFKGCENDQNVATSIVFKNIIELNGEKIFVQWIHQKELTCTSKTYVSYQSKIAVDDELEINVVISFDLKREEGEVEEEKVLKCQDIKRHIRSFIILFCIVGLIVGIITGILQHYEVKWFCCMGWVIPVAIAVSLLVIPLYICILCLKIRYELCIVGPGRVGHFLIGELGSTVCPETKASLTEKVQTETARHFLIDELGSTVCPETKASLTEKVQTETARYIGNSLQDKTSYSQPLTHLTDVDSTYNSLPTGRGGMLKPIEDTQLEEHENLVTKPKENKTKDKKNKKSKQKLNDSKNGLEETK